MQWTLAASIPARPPRARREVSPASSGLGAAREGKARSKRGDEQPQQPRD